MNYKYKEFDLFTAADIKQMVDHDIDKALELFADSYFVTFKMQHDILQLRHLIETKNEEIQQAIDLCRQCLKSVETTIQNRK
ncbi:hypothetical protein ACFFIS_05920 [Virgibacillus soli]|uniref:Uncharacterized protein n=1 Tax=Paracerasibacillus soli TaxID=480284 RepID=A0ABU5CV90_9BACI|nr:hypothetical protein [Virgibacillus soli]MDY0409724.1 hypothetical protein [Virgibacillus soli]